MPISNSESLTLKKNIDFSEDGLLNYAMNLSRREGGVKEKLLHWDFGPLMTMKHDVKATNYLFSDEAVPFHWDGAFATEPEKLLFYCTESEGEGGETLFVNTEKVFESLTSEEKELCSKVTLTYETKKLAHYGGKIIVPLVQKHPHTGKTILRMAEKVETNLNPVSLTIEGVDNVEDFYQWLKEKLYTFAEAHSWNKGDLILVDNFTYLHGRRPLGANRSRAFKRLQIL